MTFWVIFLYNVIYSYKNRPIISLIGKCWLTFQSFNGLNIKGSLILKKKLTHNSVLGRLLSGF